MCGASDEQKQLDQEQTEFYNQAMQQQSQVYGEDQQILQAMTGIYEPILAAGPNQQGFSAAEKNSLDTQAIEGTAQNYQGAAKAVNEQIASEGGGNTYLPSGAATQLKAETAAASAQQESSEEQQITQADYQQGYNEWQQAASGLSGVASELNPVGYSGAATGAGSAAATTANQIAEENNSWINAAIGAAGAVGGGLAGNDNLFK